MRLEVNWEQASFSFMAAVTICSNFGAQENKVSYWFYCFSSSHVRIYESDHKERWVPKNWWFFELWYWRRLLMVPWTARRSNQSILKEINPEYSLGGLILKLKLQYFGYLMQRSDSFEKTLMLGKIEGGRRRGWQRMRWLDGIADSMDMSLSRLRKLMNGVTKSQTWLND